MLTVTNQNALNLQDHCDTENKCSASIGPGLGFCRLRADASSIFQSADLFL